MANIEGMKELERAMKQLGKVPQTAVTKSARSGMNIALKSARKNAPEGETGNLKKGIVLKKERKTKPGKAVYQVTMNREMNDVFVKTSANGNRSYYPASQEYGFLTVDGGYVPGYRFMSKSLSENNGAITKKILDTAGKEIEKALRG